MTAGLASRYGCILGEVETNFAEDVSTFGTRYEVLGVIDASGLTHDKENPDIMKCAPHEMVPGFPGIQGGEFTMELYLTGMGSTAAGAPTATDLYDLLGDITGLKFAATGGTADGTGTATSIDHTGVVSDAGTLMRVGAKNDGRGDGNFQAVSADSGSTLTLLTAMDAAANAADVVYGGLHVYALEDPSLTTAPKSYRFRLLTLSGQYDCHGCYCTGLSITGTNPGEIPRVTITWGVSRWLPTNPAATFPPTEISDAKEAAPVAGGNLFFQDFGTTTRNELDLRGFSLNIDFNYALSRGIDGVGEYQNVTCISPDMMMAEVSLTFDKPVAPTVTFDADWLATTPKHALVSLSLTDGRAVAFYFPRLISSGTRYTQQDLDGLSVVNTTWMASTVTSAADNKAKASWILAMS